MPDFRLCAALRSSDGSVGEPLHEETIVERSIAEAIAQAKIIDLDMTELKANILFLIDARGHVVWSLRLADTTPSTQSDG